jgi:alanine dehydrogenase
VQRDAGGVVPAQPAGLLTVKVVTVFDENHAAGLPSHLATINLFDPQTGACRAFMDATYITAIRTAASAAVATRLLARPDSRVLTILGAGVQALNHLRVFPLVRSFEEIRIGSAHFEDAQALAERHPNAHAIEDFEAAVRDSDVVALTTHSGQPVIDAGWIRPGTHVTSVGYRPPAGELPRGLLARASLFVETRRACEPPPVGCAELGGVEPAAATELGEVAAGARPGPPKPRRGDRLQSDGACHRGHRRRGDRLPQGATAGRRPHREALGSTGFRVSRRRSHPTPSYADRAAAPR